MTNLVPAHPSSPMFVLPASSHLVPSTYRAFHRVFKGLVSLMGEDLSLYSSHWFYNGGALYDFQLRVPPHVIKSRGNWRSDAYLGYMDITYQHRLPLAHKLSLSLVKTG